MTGLYVVRKLFPLLLFIPCFHMIINPTWWRRFLMEEFIPNQTKMFHYFTGYRQAVTTVTTDRHKHKLSASVHINVTVSDGGTGAPVEFWSLGRLPLETHRPSCTSISCTHISEKQTWRRKPPCTHHAPPARIISTFSVSTTQLLCGVFVISAAQRMFRECSGLI